MSSQPALMMINCRKNCEMQDCLFPCPSHGSNPFCHRLDNAYATTEVLDASYVFSCSEADLLFRASHWRGCEVAVRLDRSIVPLFKNMNDVTESVDARGLLSRFEADLLLLEPLINRFAVKNGSVNNPEI